MNGFTSCICVVSPQQLDSPHEELLSSTLQIVEVELDKLAEIPWLYHILQPNDEEVSVKIMNYSGHVHHSQDHHSSLHLT